MDYSKIALFTDLDGTLFDDDKKVSQRNIAAIEAFVSGGGLFGISTGRSAVNVRDMLPGIPINGWSVLFNGAAAYHLERGEFGPTRSLDKAAMLPLLRWSLEKLPQINIQIATPDKLVFVSSPALADDHFVRTHQPAAFVDLDAASEEVWLKAVLCSYDGSLEQLRRQAISTGVCDRVDCVYSWDYYLEFLPQGANKGTCLQTLRRLDGMVGKTVVAIGDYTNDLELLKEADIAVAVDNALPEVKAVADHVICSNNEDALAYLIEQLLPKL